MTRSIVSKRRRRRMRGKLRAAILEGLRSGPPEPFDVAELKAAARRRYSLAELLKGSEAIKRLNDYVAGTRNGQPVRREFTGEGE